MFGIPSSKFLRVGNPYAPKEILSKFDGKTTQYIAAVGDKDADRLQGNSLFDIFKDWCGEQYFTYNLEPHFSDYGDVDSKALNQEIKGDLERYLK